MTHVSVHPRIFIRQLREGDIENGAFVPFLSEGQAAKLLDEREEAAIRAQRHKLPPWGEIEALREAVRNSSVPGTLSPLLDALFTAVDTPNQAARDLAAELERAERMTTAPMFSMDRLGFINMAKRCLGRI